MIPQAGLEKWEPVQVRIVALADRLEQNDPDGTVDVGQVLEVAEHVSLEAEPLVLARIMTLILSPYEGETYREYAARLREAVTG
ncbi:hypothetical protein [Streptomyces sp. Root369]|uniref:hypothetical protein n=1 Tax=Streptomyces sp. Root369 TaxID=1736523 RepID=UPI0007098C97|nr:hypothetical protein [Streptomyces sp. Root369]KQW13559.1 hypothetical protein ASD08_30815 [Streptomyces sp. Root369]